MLFNVHAQSTSSSMEALRAVPPNFFDELSANPSVEIAMLLRRNGRLLAAWSRAPVSWDVISIMAATTVGSLETMLETLRSPSPQTVAIVAGGNRFLLEKFEPQAVLVLIAKDTVAEAVLRDAAKRLLARLAEAVTRQASRRVTLGPSAHSRSSASDLD